MPPSERREKCWSERQDDQAGPSPLKGQLPYLRRDDAQTDLSIDVCNRGVVPIVLAHARALLASGPHGRTAYVDADLHDVESILSSAQLRETLDLTRPAALSVIAVLHFFPDSDDPHGIVRRLVDALPAGSYLALTHGTADFTPAASARAAQAYRDRGISAAPRSRAEVTRFFDGLELLDPGVQVVHRWRPDGDVNENLTDEQVSIYGAVARIP